MKRRKGRKASPNALLAAEQATDDGQVADSAAALLLLLLVSAKDTTQAEAIQQLVDTKATEEAVDQTAQSETVEQLADEAEHTGKQETDCCQDLEERLGEKTPERVELLLCVWHVLQLLLRVVDGRDNGGCKLLECVCQPVLLRRGVL